MPRRASSRSTRRPKPGRGISSGVCQPICSHTVRTSSLRRSAGKTCTVSWISAIARRLRRSPAKVVEDKLRMRGSMRGPGKGGTFTVTGRKQYVKPTPPAREFADYRASPPVNPTYSDRVGPYIQYIGMLAGCTGQILQILYKRLLRMPLRQPEGRLGGTIGRRGGGRNQGHTHGIAESERKVKGWGVPAAGGRRTGAALRATNKMRIPYITNENIHAISDSSCRNRHLYKRIPYIQPIKNDYML